MSFHTHVAHATHYGRQAHDVLHRYNYSLPATDPSNRSVIMQARDLISPHATDAGSRALDAAVYDRWISRSQVRDVGNSLEMLHRGWMALNPEMPRISEAQSQVRDALYYLQRASYNRPWGIAA